jgi:hypothetical protein
MEATLNSGEAAVPKRVSVDIEGLEQDIETCRDDPAWKQLSLAAKLRVLIEERLQDYKAQQEKP